MATYTPSQITSYLTHLGLPSSPLPSPTLSFLHTLHTHNLLHIPFENLALHYSASPGISTLSPDALFTTLITHRRGGYCMQLNGALLVLLRSLGYDAWATGAKVYGPDRVSGGWDHMVILVEFAESGRWVVDVGFGGNGPAQPMQVGGEYVGIGKQQHRVVERGGERTKWWVMQVDEKGSGEWKDGYRFSIQVEFGREDFEVMNFSTSRGFVGPFLKMVVCTKMVEEGGVLGRITVVDGVWKRRVGEKLDERELNGEDERGEALKDWFGIVLDQDERDGIRGSALELKKVAVD